MGELIWALVAFVGTHFLMSHPLRKSMAGALGAVGFQAVYSLVSFATLGWVVWAFKKAPMAMPLWAPGDAEWIIATVLMLIGSILLAGSFFGNPALPAPGAIADAAKPARGVFAITRHPMMWSFALWGIVHALVAPFPATLALTIGMTILALGGSAGQDMKKRALMGEAWIDWMSRTSFVPFARQISGKASWGSIWPGRTIFLLGVIIWLLGSYAHPWLGGPLAGIWHWLGAPTPAPTTITL